jgi:hypothetical protein
MIEFIRSSLQLQSIITAHNQTWTPRFLFILLLVQRRPANDLRCRLQTFSTDHAQKTYLEHRILAIPLLL